MLALRWKRPVPPVSLRWRGPDQVMLEALAENPERPVAAIIGPRGEAGPEGPVASIIDAGTFN